MRLYEIENIANINYGTRVVKKRDSGTIYDVYGGGGKTFKVDSFNRENCVIVSRFGMSEECVRKVDGKFFLNDSGLSVETKNSNVVIQKYIDWFLFSKMFDIYLLGRGAAQKNLDVDKFRSIKIPVPSLQEQEKIVEKLDTILQTVEFKKRKNIQIQLEVEQLLASKMYKIFDDEQNKSTKFINFSDSVEVINKISVKKKDYLTSGEYPIVAQEKSLINGYTDNNQNIIESPSPLVGFGDHTKVIKFIDFPFIKGADGLKVFKVIEEILPKYFYYWLKSLNLKDLGYARHSKLLNNYKINVPSLKQQEKIVKKIDDLMIIKENIIVNYKNSNKNIETLKKSILYKEFSYE